MAESSSHQQHKKHNSSSSAGSGGGIAGDSKKWACMYCTYLNWEANFKCVLCNQARHRPMLIEELCPPADCRTEPTHSDSIFPDDHQLQLVGIGVDEMSRWPCPTCTYMNCRRTKRCIQCHTDRPTAYTTPPNSKNGSPKGSSSDAGNHGQSIHQPVGRKNSQHQQQNLQETQQLISRALNKWSCSSCTFDNWPTASKCTICGQPRSSAAIREQSRSPPNQSQQQQRKRKQPEYFGHSSSSSSTNQSEYGAKKLRISVSDEGESQHQKQLKCLEENTGTAGDLEQLERLSIVAGAEKFKQQEYASALDIYARRFLANDPVEKLFFRAAGAIGHSELQMVNKVVDYLINEGNLQRSLTAFEARLMNQYIARGGTCRVVGFERADSLFFLAKKSDSLDLMKLIRRVRTDDDRLPCSLNCVTRTRLFAKVTAQCMAVRDGPSGSGQFFKCQFIAHPYNFNLLNLPMPGSDLSLAVQNALFRPAPCIPPQFCYIDCFDAMASQGGLIVGRPPNFLMRNRGAANSLYDSVFQTMFGVCDRFNILRAATKYTMHRSSNLFKIRWIEQQRRMIRDCGLSVAEGELDADWNDILNSVGEEDECTEPIHIWALAHICCRPIIVCPMDDPVDVDQLLSPLGGNGAGIGRSGSPREQGGRMGADNQTQDTTEGNDNRRSQHEEKAQPRQTNYHIYEGIYLPILWAPSAPITRSPLIICYRNGLFHAVAISDTLYQRDAEVQRYVRIKRPLRRPGTAGDSLFRFLCRTELDNSALLAQFILFGHSTAQQLSIRREPHPFLMETLHFYKNWMQAMLQLSGDGNGTCGASSTNQLETRMDTIMMGKKRKGGDSPSPALLQPHQQALMVQLFSPQITQQSLSLQQQQSEAGCQEEATFGRCWQNDD